MDSVNEISQKTKSNRAIARCILTGTASVVATYLIWRGVHTVLTEVPSTFLFTCCLVGFVSILSPSVAIYRIAKHQPLIKKVSSKSIASPAKKIAHIANYSSNLLMAVSIDKSSESWYQRN